MKFNILDKFIGTFYIDSQLCDDIIKYHQFNAQKFKGRITSGVDETIKKSTDSLLNSNPELYKNYINNLQLGVNEYRKHYTWCDMSDVWSETEGVNIQHYKPDEGYYAWHTERFSKVTSHRHLVFLTYLNDVYDAGETEFYSQNLKIKPEKGLTIIFPTDWTFTHRGIPSPSEDKYIVTGWFTFV